MIGLEVSVPVACWRRGRARELLESEVLPPPATCYGALLSLVGEPDRERHRGCRVSAGLLNMPATSLVLRTLWQLKDLKEAQGSGQNVGPDLQELMLETRLVVWCDSSEEPAGAEGLEQRVVKAFREPEGLRRFGGWSLGESTHLINDANLLPDGVPPGECQTFLCEETGPVSLPVWVDHVGSSGTRYAVGALRPLRHAPRIEQLPRIPPPESSTSESASRRRRRKA